MGLLDSDSSSDEEEEDRTEEEGQRRHLLAVMNGTIIEQSEGQGRALSKSDGVTLNCNTLISNPKPYQLSRD